VIKYWCRRKSIENFMRIAIGYILVGFVDFGPCFLQKHDPKLVINRLAENRS
jgi:hypothetical protein